MTDCFLDGIIMLRFESNIKQNDKYNLLRNIKT